MRSPTDGSYALFDDHLGATGSRLFTGLAGAVVCTRTAELEGVFAELEAARARGCWAVVLAAYELGFLLEPALEPDARPWSSEPLLTALLFERVQQLDPDATERWLAARLAELTPEQRFCGIAGLESGLPEEAYRACLGQIQERIARGDCYQVNFTFPLRFRHYGDPLALYARLRERQPVRYGAFVRRPRQAVLSLSPELFLRRDGPRLTACPMKGTAPRGETASQDDANRARLAASEKDRAENVMIVDLIRNDLGRVATPGSVRVETLCQIEAYPTVWQMTSRIGAEAPRATLAEVFGALFPCGSVTGAPKIRAMQIAAELERAPRGLYTGALGYLAPDGDFLFAVAIRTPVLQADGSGSLGVGSGVVADSDPAAEHAECHWKARFLTELTPGFELIETILCDPERPDLLPFLGLHLARLAGSARFFGFVCDSAAVGTALMHQARGLPRRGRHKLRLQLARTGDFRIESEPLEPDSSAPLGLRLSPHRVDSRDLFLRHKTTHRPLYDAELARAAAEPGCFDVLFCNERGELCEGARSSLFLSRAGRLLTPPLSSGLLDGVMRRHLLARQDPPAREQTLFPEDLTDADAVYLANAVRGLRLAKLLGAA